MQYRTLGRTGLRVSEVGFGAWAIGGAAKLGQLETGWGEVDEAKAVRAIEAAYDAGVTFFDRSASLVLKHPFSIFNELMPSVTRLPRAGYELFNWTFSPDVEILSNYTMWTAFPYGRMTRDVLRVYENPSMFPDWLFGLGVHRMQWNANARRKRQQGK